MQTLIQNVEQKFRELFNEEPMLVRSPGRINLIGEHTDYNEGFVLPASIDRAIYFALGPRTDRRCHFFANDLNDEFQCQVDELAKSEKGWPNYLCGVVDQIKKQGYAIPGFNCVFGGNIPIASGLSSSAAIEAGLAYALNTLFHFHLNELSLVKLAQKAENEFVGVQCGIMDQLINIYGRERKVLKLDCRTLAYEYYPFERDDLQLVLCDTRVHRELAASEYNLRRLQCEAGVEALRKHDVNIRSLRDVNLDFLKAHRKELSPIIYRRCKYVIEENERVLAACLDLKREDFGTFGQRMFASHAGLRDEYEVSCAELDVLVEKATQIDGVLGARMMGAGFGGCTINLVQQSALENFYREMNRTYKNATQKDLLFYPTQIEAGTSQINVQLIEA